MEYPIFAKSFKSDFVFEVGKAFLIKGGRNNTYTNHIVSIIDGMIVYKYLCLHDNWSTKHWFYEVQDPGYLDARIKEYDAKQMKDHPNYKPQI